MSETNAMQSTSSTALADCTIRISDDEILSLWRTVRPSTKQDKAMVYQSGPYDIDNPTFELRHLIELAIGYGATRALSHDVTGSEENIP